MRGSSTRNPGFQSCGSVLCVGRTSGPVLEPGAGLSLVAKRVPSRARMLVR